MRFHITLFPLFFKPPVLSGQRYRGNYFMMLGKRDEVASAALQAKKTTIPVGTIIIKGC